MNGTVRIEEIIKKDGMYVSTTSGYSMSPMLKDRRDTVVILPPPEKIKKYDVILYFRDGRYILHRVVRARHGEFVTCGDNRVELEKGITRADIVGILSEVYRGKKKIRMNGIFYKLYSRFAVLSFYPRKLFRDFKVACGRIPKK